MTVSLAIAIGTRVWVNVRRSVTTWILSTWPIAGWKPQSVWTWEPIPRQCLLQQQPNLAQRCGHWNTEVFAGGEAEGGISTRFHRLNCTILTWDALAVAYLPPVQFALQPISNCKVSNWKCIFSCGLGLLLPDLCDIVVQPNGHVWSLGRPPTRGRRLEWPTAAQCTYPPAYSRDSWQQYRSRFLQPKTDVVLPHLLCFCFLVR